MHCKLTAFEVRNVAFWNGKRHAFTKRNVTFAAFCKHDLPKALI